MKDITKEVHNNKLKIIIEYFLLNDIKDSSKAKSKAYGIFRILQRLMNL